MDPLPTESRPLTMLEELRRRIPPDELALTFSRSGGPGGQNVNKVSTRVTVGFELFVCTALSDHEKNRIAVALRGRINNEGVLQVTSMRHRTQSANREAATDRFYELLAEALAPRKTRRPTKATHGSRMRRLNEKKQHSERKAGRKRVARDE